MTIKAMRAKRATLITEARAERSKITDNTPAGDAAEIEARFEVIIGEAESLGNAIAAEERMVAAEASLAAADDRAPTGGSEVRTGDQAPANLEYRDAFYQLILAGGEVHDVSPEVRNVLRNGAANFTEEQRAQVAGTGAAGGFLVPDEMMSQIVIAMAAWGPMFNDDFATVITTQGGGSLPIPGVDDTARRAAKNTTEGQPLTDDGGADAVFTRKTLEDYLYDTEWLRISIQLATGGMANMESLIGQLLGEGLGRTANDALTTGSGAGEPLGAVTGAGVGKTLASLSGFTADEILELIHSVDPAYRRSPKFGLMFNDDTLLAMNKMKDGDGRYLLQLGNNGESRLVIGNTSTAYTINQAMASIGANARPMIAGDMSKYWVRKIGSTVIGTDRGKEFFPGFGMAGYQRLDGTVADARAIRAMVAPAA